MSFDESMQKSYLEKYNNAKQTFFDRLDKAIQEGKYKNLSDGFVEITIPSSNSSFDRRYLREMKLDTKLEMGNSSKSIELTLDLSNDSELSRICLSYFEKQFDKFKTILINAEPFLFYDGWFIYFDEDKTYPVYVIQKWCEKLGLNMSIQTAINLTTIKIDVTKYVKIE